MKRTTALISILILLVSIPAHAEANQKAEWKGKVEIEAGVKVIKNPREPIYGKIKFELREDLSIGREDDDNYLFYRVRGINVDAQANIYVTDYGNYRIQKFNQDGIYLTTIGSQGQGPGEFRFIMQVEINDTNGDILVLDGLREIEKFDKQGNHVKTIKLEKSIDSFYYTRGDHSLALQHTISDEEISKAICKLNSKGEILENYVKIPYEMFYKREGELVTVGDLPYAHDLFFAKLGEGRYVYGHSEEYELNVIDDKGDILLRINKDEPYQDFSLSEKRKYKRFSLPSHKPFYYSIIADNLGRIYVQRNRTRGEDFKVNREVDIFSKDGYFLYKSTIPRGTYIIKDGYLYAYVMDEDTGEELVKRYRIKNWNKIKEGI